MRFARNPIILGSHALGLAALLLSDKGWQGKHSKAVVVKAITDGIDGTKMKAFKDKFKAEEIDAIAAYVKKLK